VNRREWVQEVADHCWDLSDGTVLPKDTNDGLCDELELFCRINCYYMKTVFLESPENLENNATFPVPSTHLTQKAIFYHYDNEWLDNDYGDARRRLCAWIAEWLEENIEELI